MHVVVNEKLVRSKVRLASVCHFAALGVFAVGLWISMVQQDVEQIFASYASIVIGLVLYNLGQFWLRRWGPRFRQDGVLVRALKGLDNRYSFLAFPANKLPDYILVGPGGVHVIVARGHNGTISCQGDRWTRETRGGLLRLFSLFGGTPLGDPGRDAGVGIQRIREALRARGFDGDREPRVGAVIVFTNPTAKLRVSGCSYPVTTPKQLRNHLRGAKGALSQQGVAEVTRALEG